MAKRNHVAPWCVSAALSSQCIYHMSHCLTLVSYRPSSHRPWSLTTRWATPTAPTQCTSPRLSALSSPSTMDALPWVPHMMQHAHAPSLKQRLHGPAELPFPCIPINNKRMRAWLLDRYASSTFNTCPHCALPSMGGPPVEIHVDPATRPKACHTPAPVPLHWQQGVYEDLLRDEALGIIECVPYGEPTTWCHRMVITHKHDGSPRCTVDLVTP